MLRIHRAERVDTLVDALGRLLQVTPSDPFTPEVVAVPTRGMERWLSQRLSHLLGTSEGDGTALGTSASTSGVGTVAGLGADGVCAHVDFPAPSRLVADVVATVSGEDPATSPWRPARLRWSVLAAVDEALELTPAPAVLAPLFRYLDQALPGAERRLLAASTLADRFAAYGADRPAMLVDWAQGRDTDGLGDDLADDLCWQPDLFRRVRSRLGSPSPAERLDDVCDAIRSSPDAVGLPERLSVLGPTRLTLAELRVLAALSVERDVHLWLPHPSPAMWQKVAGQAAVSVGSSAPGLPPRRRDTDAAEQVEVTLLAGLGRDSLELQQRLAALDVPSTDERHDAAERPRTLLGALQQTLAEDRLKPIDAVALDRSVEVHACHGAARQVEVLREVIVGLLADDPTLQPRDIVVMVPHIEEFAPLISATFGLSNVSADSSPAVPRHPGQRLRVRLADRSLRQTNPVLGVAADLLDLADARVTASEVLDLAATAPVRRRFGFSDEALERIRTWVAESGIRWGFDEDHRARAGLPGVIENTWRRGLDRLLLGVTMAEDAQQTVGGVLPFDDMGSQDAELAGTLAEYLDRLEGVLASLRRVQPVGDWMQSLNTALDLLTDVEPGEQVQDVVARGELGAIAADADEHAHDTRLAIGDMRALLSDRLAGRPTRASFRTGDLTVCSLVPMRAVPHRVVCILGLDDGAFPRAGHSDGDDVLARQPLVGERDVRSEDGQILLDALHSATETLVLCYSGSDPRSNADRPPCVPLGEILDTLVDLRAEDRPVADREQARRAIPVRHPLQPFDPRNFIAGRLGVDRPFSFDRHQLAGSTRALGTRQEPALPAELRLATEASEADLQLDELIRFAQNPAQDFLRRRLGVSPVRIEADEVNDMLSVQVDGLQRWSVADRLLQARISGVDPVRARDAERARGLLPPGGCAAEPLEQADTLAESVFADFQARGLPASRTVDVTAVVGSRTILGSVAGVRGTTATSLTVSRLAAKHRLRAWVHLLALTVTDPSQPWQSLVIGRNPSRSGRPVATFEVGPIEHGQAVRHLHRLVDMMTLGTQLALPCAPRSAEAYARHRLRSGSADRAVKAARQEWEPDRRTPGESAETAHELVWGEAAPLADLLDVSVPGLDLADEEHAFGALAMLVWAPLLAAGGVTS